MNDNKICLFRLINSKDRVGAIVIGRKVEVYPHQKHQRNKVIVDGVTYYDFTGASFIKEFDEKESEQLLDLIKKDVLDFDRI